MADLLGNQQEGNSDLTTEQLDAVAVKRVESITDELIDLYKNEVNSEIGEVFKSMIKSYVGETKWEKLGERIIEGERPLIKYSKADPLDFQSFREILESYGSFIEFAIGQVKTNTSWFSIEGNPGYAKSIISTFFQKAGVNFDISSRISINRRKINVRYESDPLAYQDSRRGDPLLQEDIEALEDIITNERNLSWKEIAGKVKGRTGRTHGQKRYKQVLDDLEIDYTIRFLDQTTKDRIAELLIEDYYAEEIADMLGISRVAVANNAPENINLMERSGKIRSKRAELARIHRNSSKVEETPEFKPDVAYKVVQGFFFENKSIDELADSIHTQKRAKTTIRRVLGDADYLEDEQAAILLDAINTFRDESISTFDLAVRISKEFGFIVNPNQIFDLAIDAGIDLEFYNNDIQIPELMQGSSRFQLTYSDVQHVKGYIELGYSSSEIFSELEGEKREWNINSFKSVIDRGDVFNQSIEIAKSYKAMFNSILYDEVIEWEVSNVEKELMISNIERRAFEAGIPRKFWGSTEYANIWRQKDELFQNDSQKYIQYLAEQYGLSIDEARSKAIGIQLKSVQSLDQQQLRTISMRTVGLLQALDMLGEELGLTIFDSIGRRQREESRRRKEIVEKEIETLYHPNTQRVLAYLVNFLKVKDDIAGLIATDLNEYEIYNNILKIQYSNRHGNIKDYFSISEAYEDPKYNYQMAIMLSSIYFSSDEKLFGAMAAVDSIFSDVEDQLGLLCALDSRRSEAIKYIRDMYFIPTELSERIYNRYIDIVLKES